MSRPVGFIGGGRSSWPARVVASDTEPKPLEVLRAAFPDVVTVLGDNIPAASPQGARLRSIFDRIHPAAAA